MMTWLIVVSIALVLFTFVCEAIFYTEEQQT